MNANAQVVSLLLGDIVAIISGTFFLVLGLLSILIAAARRHSGVRILVWLGLWSGMYGANELVRSDVMVAALPNSRFVVPLLVNTVAYLFLVVGSLSFRELSQGKLRRVLQVLIAADMVVATAGIATYLITGKGEVFTPYNNLLAVITTAVLVGVVAVPKLSRKYMVVSGYGVLTLGMVIFATQALYANVSNIAGWSNPPILSSLGFAALLLSFGYTAMKVLVGNESRLLSIEKELEIARDLQFSILPAGAPDVAGLRIASVYEPMTAVAGDFYSFINIDKQCVGILIADVSGHGVPAALIAAMIKVAAQSVNQCANRPGQVIRRLGNVLSDHLRGQLVSAAYLWIDTASGTARYSAAGHPPLLQWRAADGTLTRIESNGLLYGVLPDCDYPECEVPLAKGDRLLLYTDGATEPENAKGEAFGDCRLEQILRENRQASAAEVSPTSW